MTAGELPVEGLLPPPRSATSEVGWWGMVLVCLSEGALFAYLLGSYFYLGVDGPRWPPAGIEKPTLVLPFVMTLLLVSSSVLLRLAERRFEQGELAAFRTRMVATIVLGLGFLILQVVEYRDKLHRFGPTTHAYGSLFFTITGFHGTHVAFGLLLLGWTFAREWTGNLRPQRPAPLKITSLYWHFVDGVWLVLLSVLYLIPRAY